ncbi:MAG: YciI family protein [Chloroflexi bacterium]|nr:YciI family protein [Chloroflexota bacterium]
MSKFMLIYKGTATDLAEMSEEAAATVMAKWAAWMAKVGPALVDVGTPFGPGASVVDDGSTGKPISLTGFSIVDAGTLAEAASLADGHPYLSEGRGNYSIEIYEMMPVPFEAAASS